MGSNFKPVVLMAMISGLALSSAGAEALAAPPPTPRLRPPPQEAYTPAQKQFAADFSAQIGGPAGGPASGPFGILIRRPGFGEEALGMYKDIKGPHSWDSPENRLVNLAVIMVARHWGANNAWSSHAASAARGGISADVITAIRNGEKPKFAKEDERMVYEMVNDLLVNATLRQSTYDKATAVLGTDEMVHIVVATGFYSTLAMAMVSFDNSVSPSTVYDPLPTLPGK